MMVKIVLSNNYKESTLDVLKLKITAHKIEDLSEASMCTGFYLLIVLVQINTFGFRTYGNKIKCGYEMLNNNKRAVSLLEFMCKCMLNSLSYSVAYTCICFHTIFLKVVAIIPQPLVD